MMKLPTNQIVSPRSAYRVLDIPGLGSFELTSGQGGTSPKAYVKSAWAHAAMNIRAQELAGLPWRIAKDGITQENHPLLQLLTDFGRESNYAEAMAATEIDLLTFGKSFWLLDGDVLQHLDAPTIAVKATPAGELQFTQTINGKVVNRFAREELVYFKEYLPGSDLLPGKPLLDVVSNAIQIEYESGRYIEAFLANDATPSLLLSTEQTVEQTQLEKTLAWWNKTFRGSKKAGKVGMVDKGLKAQVLSTSLREIALVELRESARNDICAGLRVPYLLVGAMVKSTYANVAEARRFLLEEIVIPRGKYIADVINEDLVSRIDPSVKFEFLPNQIELLQEAQTIKWDRLDRAVQRGTISQEFARAQMGWPESAAPSEPPAPEPQLPVLRSWSRKALKAIRAGQSADVPFETDEVSLREQVAIRAQLKLAKSVAEVEAVFQ